MGTCNFKTSDVFRNFCIVYEPPSEKDVRDVELEGYTFDFDEHRYTFYDDINYTFSDDKDDILDSNRIYYFDIKLQYGYYEGIMLEVIPIGIISQEFSLDDLVYSDKFENEYLYQRLRGHKPKVIYPSQIKRAIKSEINTLNKKVLPELAKRLGMKEFKKIGQFSNGEAVYKLL